MLKEEICKKDEKEKHLEEELEAARNQMEKLKAQELEHKKLEVKLQSVLREKESLQHSLDAMEKELQGN